MDSSALYARKRQISARKRRESDYDSWRKTEAEYRAFMELDWIISQGPDAGLKNRSLGYESRAIRSRGQRVPKGMTGHRYKSSKAQVVRNAQGKNVVVMTQAQKDQALMHRLGMNNADMD